jgi:hypothetical protein
MSFGLCNDPSSLQWCMMVIFSDLIEKVMEVFMDDLSYPAFMPKPSTHCMHDPGSIVPHIHPKVFTDNQMS